MKGNGKEMKDQDLEFKYGQMVQNMKVNGKITEQMEEESFIMQTEIIMKENGQMIKLMGMVYTFM